MKKKLVGILLAAAVMTGSVMAVPAAETESTEAVSAETAETEVIEDVKITLESGEVLLKNETKTNYTAEYKKAEEKAENEAAATETWNLILTDKEGTSHTFENAAADQWTEPSLTEEYGFLYIKYKDAGGKEQEVLEKAEEKAFEKELAMYATTEVNVRKEASKDSQSLKVASLGSEWKAVASVPGWIKVESDGISGYVFHSYITEDKAKVDALVQERKAAAEAAAQAAAQAAQEQTYYEEPSAQEPAPQEPVAQEPEQPSAPVEVSRQAFDDCDGSGHGYYEITYSDGSVAYEEY